MALPALHRVLGPILIASSVLFPLAASATPPVTPDDFHYAIYSETTAELFWLRSTNVSMQGYEITRNGEMLGVFDALSYLDNSLSPGTEYTYKITAVGVDGDRSGIATVILQTPQSADTIASLRREISSLQDTIGSLESQINGGIRSPVPRTGQTIAAQTGDDGDVQAGIAWPEPRFTLNVNEVEDLNQNQICDSSELCNGTVTDNLTGLVWLQNANCFGGGDWSKAIEDSNGLAGDGTSACGLTDQSQQGDWRLPNVKELQSLIDYGHSFPTLLLPEGHPFTDVQVGGIDAEPAGYWSSTSTGFGNDGAYSVSFSVGWVERLSTQFTDFSRFVWPVRDR